MNQFNTTPPDKNLELTFKAKTIFSISEHFFHLLKNSNLFELTFPNSLPIMQTRERNKIKIDAQI